MKDKERIENVRLRERTGGYHKFVDSAEVHNPDPTSSHFVSGKKNNQPVPNRTLANRTFRDFRTRQIRQGFRSRRPKGEAAKVPTGAAET